VWYAARCAAALCGLLLGALTPALGQEGVEAAPPLPPEPLSLTPDSAAALAVERSLQLQMDVEGVRAAEGALQTAGALAAVTAQYEGTVLVRGPAPSLPPELGRFFNEVSETHMLVAGKTLWSGGLIHAQKELAAAGIQSARAVLPVDRRTTALHAREDVYAVLRDEQLVAVALRQLAALSEHLRNSEKRYREGLIAFYEVVQAQVQVAAQQGQITQAQLQVEKSKTTLRSDLLVSQETPVSVEEGQAPAVVAQTPEEALALALSNRPEVPQTEAAVLLAESSVAVAERAKRAQVGLSAAMVKQTQSLTSPALAYQVSLTVTKPLNDGGASEGRLAQAQAQLAQAQRGAEVVRAQIEAEVHTRLNEVESVRSRLRTAYEQERQARELARISHLRFDNDMGLGREVIDAEASLAQAQQAITQAEYDLNVGLIRLQSAVGLDPLQEAAP